MTSQAFYTLKREMQRYASGDVRGRSFLISGHRGVGKTTLVLRAVEDIERAAIEAASAWAAEKMSANQANRLRRPLLVKLHGPSLLSSELPNLPKSNQQSGPKDDEKPSSEAHAALVQITISLYRALTSEVSRCFAIHAREENRVFPRGDQLELAGQLTLELDRAPDAAVLRSYWRRIRRLDHGVLWPRKVGEKEREQGIREIVAITTVAQAFQVCSGAVSYSRTEKGSSARELTIEQKADLNFKDAINSSIGALAGALVGLGVWLQGAGAITAGATGIAGGIISSFALSWTRKQSAQSQRTSDYSFMLDRKIETLDRDLPLLIERIREAGLAPIFLVDELDKLSDPSGKIGLLVQRLKHIFADFGFFCFVTDRDYFELLRNKLQTEAYPREHTYFTHRLFICYQPRDLMKFLTKLLESDQALGSQGQQGDNLDAELFARYLMHKSKVNVVDALREIARFSTPSGALCVNPEELRNLLRYRIPITVQLAIEQVLERPELRNRTSDDPRLAQLASDALYMISRLWEAEKTEVTLGKGELLNYLNGRTQSVAVQVGEPLRETEFVSSSEVGFLLEQLEALRVLLEDFVALRTEVNFKISPDDPVGSRLIDVIPDATTSGLLEVIERTESTYRVLFDVHGRDLTTRTALQNTGVLTPEIRKRIQNAILGLEIIAQTFGEVGVQFEDLVYSKRGMPRSPTSSARMAPASWLGVLWGGWGAVKLESRDPLA